MAKLELKRFSSADETRQFKAHGHIDLVNIEGGTIGRGVFDPGWKWSADVKPIAGTESCEASHSGYVLSGRMHIKMDDGQEADIGPGDYVVIPPGHDAWVLGKEACVMLDVAGAAQYARPLGARATSGQEQPGAHH